MKHYLPWSAGTLFVVLAISMPSQAFAAKCPNPANIALERAAKAIISGPAKKKLCIHHHQFRNITKGTIVRNPDGKVAYMTGKISHDLCCRPDDQIYYQVNYLPDGQPDLQHMVTRTDRGGFSSLLNITTLPIKDLKVQIGGKVLSLAVTLDPQAPGKVAEAVSALVEGKGWEEQATAIISYAALYAPLPREKLPPALR
jgi:hypothetical protein